MRETTQELLLFILWKVFIFLYYFIRLDHLLFSPIKMSEKRLARQALYPDKCQMHTSTSLKRASPLSSNHQIFWRASQHPTRFGHGL